MVDGGDRAAGHGERLHDVDGLTVQAECVGIQPSAENEEHVEIGGVDCGRCSCRLDVLSGALSPTRVMLVSSEAAAIVTSAAEVFDRDDQVVLLHSVVRDERQDRASGQVGVT